jgi:protease I
VIQVELEGKRIVIVTGNGFVEPELQYPRYRLQEEGATVTVATMGKNPVKGLYGYPITPDVDIASLNPNDFDALFTPGGWSPYDLRNDQKLLGIVKEMYKDGKVVSSICRGVLLLTSAGIMKGKRATTWKDVVDDLKNAGAIFEDVPVVRDGNIVTSRVPSDLPKFLPVLIQAIKG